MQRASEYERTLKDNVSLRLCSEQVRALSRAQMLALTRGVTR